MKRRSFAASALGSSALAVALTFGVGACQIGEEDFPPNAGPSASITSVTVAPTILRFGNDDEQPGSEGCVATVAGPDGGAPVSAPPAANACVFTVTVNYSFDASTTFVSRALVTFEAIGAPQTFNLPTVNTSPAGAVSAVTIALPVTLPPTLIQRGDHDFTVRLVTNTGATSLPVTAAIGVR